MTEQDQKDRFTTLKEADSIRLKPSSGNDGRAELPSDASTQPDVFVSKNSQSPPLIAPNVVSHAVSNNDQFGHDACHPQGIRSRWANTAAAPAKEKVVEPKKKGKMGRIFFIATLVIVAPILAVGSAVLTDPRFSRVMSNPKEAAVFCRVIGHMVQPSVPVASRWLYSQSYALDSSDTTGLVDLALLKQRSGEKDAAKADYEHLLTISPNARIWNNLGNIYQDEGKTDAAIKAYTTSLTLNPDWGFAWYNRAGIYSQQGKYQQAIDDYSQAIKHRYATAYFRRAEIYKYLGKYDLAARDVSIIRKHGYTDEMFDFMKAPPPADEL